MFKPAPMVERTGPVVLWWIWQQHKDEPLVGYFLGLARRSREEGEDVAIVVYEPEEDIVWLAFLKGILWRVDWQQLQDRWIRIVYGGKDQESNSFDVQYDPDRVILEVEKPIINFVGKYQGFKLQTFSVL